MYVLNLDRNFKPKSGDEIEYELFQFSGGEWHIKIKNPFPNQHAEICVTHRVNNGECLMQLLIAVDALRNLNVGNIHLIMPYIPYARQDRKCYSGESFSLKVFCSVINSMNFSSVTVIDSHSDVAPALLNNCINISNREYIKDIVYADFDEKPILISPDAGSNKKCNKLAIELELDLVKCDKVRDVKTGELSGFEAFSNNLFGRDCLIVDDICDGGGTFIGLAKELKAKNAGKLHLFTTHGIYSKGFEIFKGVFDTIYCTNSIKDIHDPYIKQKNILL